MTLPRTHAWLGALSIALVVFVLQWSLTNKLNANDHLRILNRYFDADNAWYLINFETGEQKFGSYGGRNPIHPNIANFIHPLVMAAAGSAQFVTHRSNAPLVTAASLAVAPAAAALRSGLLFIALVTAGFSLFDALCATLLASVAFSSVLFGCLPESFVLSSAWFAAYFALAAHCVRAGKIFPVWWVVIGMLLSSTTITNLAPFALALLLLLAYFLKTHRAILKTAAITTAALFFTIFLFIFLTAAHGSFKGMGRHIGQFQEVRFSAKSMLVGFPLSVARTLVAVRPNQLTGTDEEGHSQLVQVIRFTYRDELDAIKNAFPNVFSYQRFMTNDAAEIVVFILIAAAGFLSAGVLKQPLGVIRALFALSLMQLGAHWLLHSCFGFELFLYSQHWIIPLVIAVCCGSTLTDWRKWISRAIVLTLLIAAAIQTTSVMNALISA